MKTTKLICALLAMLAAATVQAQISLQDPVITDTYMKFVGENPANNYRFILDTYEWPEGRGPQFQITLERIDATKAAQFTAADLSDPNHWEPMFRNLTKQMAGEEMTAQDNVKRLYVKDVAMLDGQFHDYNELHIIGIESAGDYLIPDGCFSEITHLETLDCHVQGTLTLGKDIVNKKITFTVKVYTQQSAEAWKAYKESTGAVFTIDDSGVDYGNGPKILSVSGNTTVNNDANQEQALPDQAAKIPFEGAITRFLLNSFTAQTSGNVTELFMDYCVYLQEQGGQQHEWKQVYATDQGNGVWKYEGEAINVLEGLESHNDYRLDITFNTNAPDMGGDRAHYPTNGETVSILFTTGEIPTGIQAPSTLNGQRSMIYDLLGRRAVQPARGIYVQKDGRKLMR